MYASSITFWSMVFMFYLYCRYLHLCTRMSNFAMSEHPKCERRRGDPHPTSNLLRMLKIKIYWQKVMAYFLHKSKKMCYMSNLLVKKNWFLPKAMGSLYIPILCCTYVTSPRITPPVVCYVCKYMFHTGGIGTTISLIGRWYICNRKSLQAAHVVILVNISGSTYATTPPVSTTI